jgi:hypothetical protein
MMPLPLADAVILTGLAGGLMSLCLWACAGMRPPGPPPVPVCPAYRGPLAPPFGIGRVLWIGSP